ncbi:MAG TPA: Crp/Fnr family transcriptional regulator [candidate division Zixibacteria bacterium]|nr:Crp/Fnr family transcriptional regulator [candidate division Zixibacteria bacterium]
MTTLDDQAALEALRGCPLFAPCPEPVLAEVGRRLRHRHFRRNEVIFHQGDPGDALHVIVDGAVKIVLPSPEGEEAIIATLRAGDFFGELALIDSKPRSASAIAVEQTDTLTLPGDVFRELVNQHPELRDTLFASLAALLRRTTRHVEELHFLDLAGRLAARLAQLARQELEARTGPGAAGRDIGPVELDWPYTQSDLAAMIGGTRQSVNRLLADLIDEGLIRVERERLIVTDVPALERRAER